DGLIDLVTSNSTGNNISIMLGDGNGAFGSPINYATGTTASGMNKGDFNNDGSLDLVITNQGGNSVSVLLGNGDATFNNAINTPVVGGQPQVVIVHDFDNDSIPDLAVGCYSGALIIMQGDGAGNFSVLNTYYTSSGMGSITLADFDNDGILDIALPGGLTYYLYFLQGLGEGNFATPLSLSCNDRPYYLLAADLNNDTLPDIIAASHIDTSVTIFFNTGNFSFDSTAYYPFPGPYADPVFIALADFNGDSIQDILVSFGTLNGISVLPGIGNGNYSTEQHFSGASGSILAIAVDLNQDGKTDIIHPSQGTNSYYVLFNCTATAVAEVSMQNSEVKLYPTIVSDFFTVDLSNINLVLTHPEISIYDQSGKIVWRYSNINIMRDGSNSYSIRLSCPPLPAGCYFINIAISPINKNEKRYFLNGKIIII
ncbi:MAG: FG-GAP-like repeat-containing protein, partial [Chitinophagales bacterium]